MSKTSSRLIGALFMLVAGYARAQIQVAGPGDELLIFENVSFGPGGTAGSGLTRVLGTVTNAKSDYLSYAAIKVQFFDNTSHIYPRPSLTCRFSIRDLVPGESRELGGKNLRDIPGQLETPGGPVLGRKPVDCNVQLKSLNITGFSLEIISVLHGSHVLTTLKPLTRLHQDTGDGLPWYLLKDETEVEVLAFIPGRDSPYKVKILDDGSVGYVESDRVVATPETMALKPLAEDSTDETQARRQSERAARLTEKYGVDNAVRILAGRLWVGMTREMALESRGKPERVSRALLIESVHEQWMYASGLSLEFDDGVLTSIRDTR